MFLFTIFLLLVAAYFLFHAYQDWQEAHNREGAYTRAATGSGTNMGKSQAQSARGEADSARSGSERTSRNDSNRGRSQNKSETSSFKSGGSTDSGNNARAGQQHKQANQNRAGSSNQNVKNRSGDTSADNSNKNRQSGSGQSGQSPADSNNKNRQSGHGQPSADNSNKNRQSGSGQSTANNKNRQSGHGQPSADNNNKNRQSGSGRSTADNNKNRQSGHSQSSADNSNKNRQSGSAQSSAAAQKSGNASSGSGSQGSNQSPGSQNRASQGSASSTQSAGSNAKSNRQDNQSTSSDNRASGNSGSWAAGSAVAAGATGAAAYAVKSSGSTGGKAVSRETLRFSNRETNPDDLTRINGIGPVIQKDLNEMGVYNFSQIANFSQEDIDNVNVACDFPGRIERDEWIPQARGLAQGGQSAARSGNQTSAATTGSGSGAGSAVVTRETLRFDNRETQADDLQRIKGIGPVLEKDLNDIGVYNFSQIANFSQSEIDNINTAFDFPGRIERDEWIPQARRLHQGGQSGGGGGAAVAAGAAGVVAAAGAGAVHASSKRSQYDIEGVADSASAEDFSNEIAERIKVLNLRESDAPRLAVNKQEFSELAKAAHGGLDRGRLLDVVKILRWLCNEKI